MDMEAEIEDEEMEVELVFEAREVDIDYEFDAAMFFDFEREESLAEAREAERWFDTAQSYPPSPFVTKLVLREENMETLIGGECAKESLGTEIEVNNEERARTNRRIFTNLQGGNLLENILNKPLQLPTELTNYYNHGMSRAKVKSTAKPNLPRSSTLMKPTASMLAKQNRQPQVYSSRFQLLSEQMDKSICSSAVESQAAKRQKLEGGLLHKIGDAKQRTDFIHKAPKKEATCDKTSAQSRLRLTIPREPALETAHRAYRMRPKNRTEVAQVTMTAQRFKARPLNRKILEAPSLPLPKKSTPKLPEFQEFHLKTLERAMQQTSAVTSSTFLHNDSEQGLDGPSTTSAAEIGSRVYRRPSIMDAQKQDGCRTHVFKACPLDKKIFSNKGHIGVFRTNKREITVPMEFNFHTGKRTHHNPPIDLFSKLSLTSELQPSNGHRLQLPRPSLMSAKGSKENRSNDLKTEFTIQSAKEKPLVFGEKQIQSSEVRNQLSMSCRSLGVR